MSIKIIAICHNAKNIKINKTNPVVKIQLSIKINVN
jgi:hypothetical protein